MIFLTLYGLRLSFGIISINKSSQRSSLSLVEIESGNVQALSGTKERNVFICSKASSSVFAKLFITPLFKCTSGPPRASFVTSIFNALFTTFGPAISTNELSVITEKCEATRRDAGSPATGPNAAVATGTSPKVLASEINREGVYTASLVGRLLFS